MRIVMFVRGDVRRDSRVLREARTLAAAGHEVTVVDRPTPDVAPLGDQPFRIIDVPQPERRWTALTLARRPWRFARQALAIRGRSPARIAAGVVTAVVLVPWILVRGVVEIGLRASGRERRLNWLDYVFDWRTSILAWCRAAAEAAPAADVHHGHDLDAMAAAAAAARRDGAQLVYDSHEVFLAWGRHAAQPAPVRWVMARWEHALARTAAAVITVNEPCARELERRLAVRHIAVVHNCPPRWDPPTWPSPLRAAAAIPDDAPLLLCHGAFQGGRGLAETVAALAEPGLERAHLVFLGFRESDELIPPPSLATRVHRLAGVPPDVLLDWVHGADADVMVFLPVDLNHVLSTPNKLFESIAAGVPVVSSDYPARREILTTWPDGPLGVLCQPTPAAIAAAIREIVDLPPDARAELRARCLRAAHERWNWETESQGLIALYARLAAGAGASA